MVRYEDNRLFFRRFPFTAPLHGRPFKPQMTRLLFCILLQMISFTWMIVCVSLTSWRLPEFYAGEVVLPDVSFWLLPQTHILPLPDILMYVLFAGALVRAIWHTQGLAITRRFLFISSCLYLFHGMTLLVTSIPDPQPLCWNNLSLWSLQKVVALECGDSLFSAHLILTTICACVVQDYTGAKGIKFLVWLLALVSMVVRVSNRQNYTVDVLVSTVMTVLAWKHYHVLLQVPPQVRSKLVNWLEALDDDEDGTPEYESTHCEKQAKTYREIVSYVPGVIGEEEFGGVDCA